MMSRGRDATVCANARETRKKLDRKRKKLDRLLIMYVHLKYTILLHWFALWFT